MAGMLELSGCNNQEPTNFKEDTSYKSPKTIYVQSTDQYLVTKEKDSFGAVTNIRVQSLYVSPFDGSTTVKLVRTFPKGSKEFETLRDYSIWETEDNPIKH